MRSLLAGLLACLILSTIGCGGGGSSGSDGNPPAPAADRKDLLFGYYGPTGSEVSDHVNVVWLWDDQVATAMRAKRDGITHFVLPVCWKCGVEHMRWLYTGMRNAGVLANVVALYPEDEPNLAGLSESDVVALVHLTKTVAQEFSELSGVQLWAIYANTGQYPGASAFDAWGIDNYGCNCVPMPPVLPGQRILLVPGGANPWREGPERFIATANDPRVIAIIPFLWTYPQVGQGVGIRDNGMAPIYRAAGIRLTR